MRFAVAIPQFYADRTFDPAAFRSYFARVEELGVYESAWAQEGMLSVPGAGSQLSPLEAMTYAAACTSRLRLGCVVFVSTLHVPVILAKALASLDQLSLGRVEVGVGSGGPGRPFAAFGIDKARYVARFSEGVRLMKELWTSESVTFDGEFWQLKDAAITPPPFQKPHPRVWIGASSETGVRRAVRIGDGFFGAGSATTAAFASQVSVVRSALAESGQAESGQAGPGQAGPGQAGPGQAGPGFPIAKRVYISIDADRDRARARVNDGLAGIYGRRIPAIEEAAIAGTVSDCVRAVSEVASAGAELILFTALDDQLEHAEQIAAEVIPRLG